MSQLIAYEIRIMIYCIYIIIFVYIITEFDIIRTEGKGFCLMISYMEDTEDSLIPHKFSNRTKTSKTSGRGMMQQLIL